jgi:CheY-like chemotaxis protein
MAIDCDKKLRILLVDANEENRRLIKTHLRSTDWDIFEGRDTQEAIELFEKQRLDLIFIGMEMSVKDGFSFVEQICSLELQRNLPFTAVIALISWPSREEVEKRFFLGIHDYLSTPFSPDDLFGAIHRITREILIESDPVIRELIPDFLTRRKSELQKLRELFKADELEIISQIGHKLKGAAGSYGLPLLSDIGQKLEEEALFKSRPKVLSAIIEYELYLGRLRFT